MDGYSNKNFLKRVQHHPMNISQFKLRGVLEKFKIQLHENLNISLGSWCSDIQYFLFLLCVCKISF